MLTQLAPCYKHTPTTPHTALVSCQTTWTMNMDAVWPADLCTLGYHSCSENASCSTLGDNITCTCNPGFTGGGLQCSPLAEDPCDVLECTEHAQCVREAGAAVCVCEPGFTGNGINCVDLSDCEEECGNSTDIYCVLNIDGGRINCGSQQVQQLQQRVRSIHTHTQAHMQTPPHPPPPPLHTHRY